MSFLRPWRVVHFVFLGLSASPCIAPIVSEWTRLVTMQPVDSLDSTSAVFPLI